MTLILILVLATVAAVLVFDFTNGFHDAANLIATAVASRALTPIQAALTAAVFTFLGPLLGGTAVADTVGQVITLDALAPHAAVSLILCAVLAAVLWNVGTWLFGIPSSSSHALIGALIGPTVLAAGDGAVRWGYTELVTSGELVGATKILAALMLSPVAGLAVGYGTHRTARWLLRRATPRANKPIKRLQVVGTAAMAFAHGANDAQKSMGVLTLVLLLTGQLHSFEVPTWVMLLCALAMTAGTVFGGWRIVRTLGFGIYRLRPLHALDAQLASSAVIFGAALVGGPVSTTHVVTSAIMGVGASERLRGEAVTALRAQDPGPTGLECLNLVTSMLTKREVYRHLSNAADRVAQAGESLHNIVVKWT